MIMLTTLKRRGKRYVSQQLASMLPQMGEQVMQLASYFPHSQGTFQSPAFPPSAALTLPGVTLPVPMPRKPLWANYCTTPESWHQSGKDDTDLMRRLLRESGQPIEQCGAILDLGVATGRMIRHLADLTPIQTIWGVDVWASAIRWCQEHLPPFRFATTTVTPHVPFPDGTFGLIYAGSVWTHLDDLAEAWFLECHRLLRPGGRLYFTINDRLSTKYFEGLPTAAMIERVEGLDGWQRWIDFLHSSPEYAAFLKGEAQMISLGRPGICHVLWDLDYLKARLGHGWVWHSATPGAYGNQTGVVLERRR